MPLEAEKIVANPDSTVAFNPVMAGNMRGYENPPNQQTRHLP
jgi:hypothetical protein